MERGLGILKLGVWTPLPHVFPEAVMTKALNGCANALGEEREDNSFKLVVEFIQKAEKYGFDITLIAERFLGPDLESWILSSALATQTTKIELMTAVHPGIVTPQVVAKMGATLDRISGGRFAVNIVNGWWKEEFDLFGNGAWVEEPEKRYQRMEEFIQVMRGLWLEESFSFKGEFYQVNEGTLPTKTFRRPSPPIYAASSSERGKDIIARLCDLWFLAYKPSFSDFESNLKVLRNEVKAMKLRSQSYNRKVNCGISAYVICAPTQEEAEARAKKLEEYGKISRIASVATLSLGAGLVGTPQTIAERMKQYEEIGIDCLMLRFDPLVQGLDTFASEVLPLLNRNPLIHDLNMDSVRS